MGKIAKKLRRVAVLVDTSTGWGRRMIQGISNYIQTHQAWHIWIDTRDSFAHHCVPEGWPVDGVIARIHTPKMARELRDLKVPVVNVSGIRLPRCVFPRVTTNHPATAKLVAEYFIECGHQHFAYIGPLSLDYVNNQFKAFVSEISSRNQSYHSFDSHERLVHKRTKKRIADLDNWLTNLPRPVGIFCWNLREALVVLERCQETGIAVPDEVAILTGDDDPTICNLTVPTLSGVVIASEQIGFHSAKLLNDLMCGQENQEKQHLIDPIEIITRGSTDAMAITDPELARATYFMRNNITRLLTVSEIARYVPMSRRGMERKFQMHFARSPLEELRRLRLARVRQLLSTTDMSVSQIAEACGFGTPEYMTMRFHQDTGMTPLRYRTRSRSR